ncbi:MAG: flagellar motor protein MotB [Candidatus Aminicenantes bacterium]|nr:flagellar motor protein MotB [Candidatus Aminicenantes bacterium]
MKRNRIVLFVGLAVFVGLLLVPGCATKKYVRQEAAAIDQKVQGVETAIEENQKRIKEHDERLATIGSLITEQQEQIKSVDGKIEEVRKASQGKLLFKETLRNDQAKFKFDSSELAPEAKAALDVFVQRLVEENRGIYLEIQGHTDSTGEESYNLVLGKKRADAVMEYLYKQYHIPLHRMEVFSFGSSAPVGDNKTKDGRAQNRRVDILVYE